jgi:hypothetical protein
MLGYFEQDHQTFHFSKNFNNVLCTQLALHSTWNLFSGPELPEIKENSYSILVSNLEFRENITVSPF